MYHEFIFRPLYNGLVLIMDVIPGIDLGVAVILFTVIIRLILAPLSKSALLTQIRMKEVEPEANRIKTEYANDRQTQAAKTMELYKSKGIHPFSGIILLIIQLPILLGLISVFYQIVPAVGATLGSIIATSTAATSTILYSFVAVPTVKATLLGLSLTGKSLILSLLTAIIQFLQLHFSLASKQQRMAGPEPKKSPGKGDVAGNLASSMNTQMKYLMPLLAFASTYWIIPAKFPQAAGIIAIYWSVSALFTLGQELLIGRKYLKK